MAMEKRIVVLFLFYFVLIMGCKNVQGDKCCKDHPEQGSCVKGKDDNPEEGGKCWNFCIADCERGGACKVAGGKSICHCAC